MNATRKTRIILGLLLVWLIIAPIQFWFSSILNTGAIDTAVGDAVGYTAVPIFIGYFIIRNAKSPLDFGMRTLVIFGIFLVMLWSGATKFDADLGSQVYSGCAGSVNLASANQSQKSSYCQCFSNGALPIVKSATRRSAFGATTGEPMEDQLFVNAMNELAASCPLPTN